MAIRQKPITTEEEFYKLIKEIDPHERGETLYIQWNPNYEVNDENWPRVELLENFLWIHAGPNDSWWYIENGDARAWKMFPNFEERQLPWGLT